MVITLKICTFKVLKQGYKIGELLLKQTFNHVISNNFRHVYLTLEKNKHPFLEILLLDYGFYSHGIDTKGRDTVFVKDFPAQPPITNDSPLEYAIKYYPYIKLSSNSSYIVPIRPEYHKILFPELEVQSDFFVSESASAGNAIKQAYLCLSPIKSIVPGDILFFYRTQDEKAITTYGIVEEFYIEQNPEIIFQRVSKRTVYSMDDIKKMSNKKVKIILFRFIQHLNMRVSFKRLKDTKIINGSIQSILKLDNNKFQALVHEANINDSTIFN